jgi:hypothetical protein
MKRTLIISFMIFLLNLMGVVSLAVVDVREAGAGGEYYFTSQICKPEWNLWVLVGYWNAITWPNPGAMTWSDGVLHLSPNGPTVR